MLSLYNRSIFRDILARLGKNSILILIGSRQTGKTSLMRLLEEHLKSQPQPPQILFFDCERIEYRGQFSTYEKTLSFLKGQIQNFDNTTYVFLDEFQKIPGIATTLKLIADHHPQIQIIASGSSSLEIKKQMEESLVGRKRVFEIFPLTFGEYLNFSKHAEDASYKSYLRSPTWELHQLYQEAFHSYVLYGAMPAIVRESLVAEKKNELYEIYSSYLEKDIRSYIKEEKVVAFNNLLKLLASQIGNLISIEELSNTIGLRRAEIEEMIYILEQTYVIFTLKPFHANLRKEITKMSKIYFWDTGLRNMILKNFSPLEERTDEGALFENAIIAELMKNRTVTDTFYFWQTQQGTEVDLILKIENQILPIEIKYQLTSLNKLRGLNSFCDYNKIKRGYVISNGISARINSDKFVFIPATFSRSIISGKKQRTKIP